VSGKVAILFDRLGPYHVARIAAAALSFPTVAVEFGAESTEYAWDKVDAHDRFERHTLVTSGSADALPTGELAARLFGRLDALSPSVLAVPGWGNRGAMLALLWAARHGVPAVMMSASQRRDTKRWPWRELAKSRVVALCSAGLVGGTRHAAYLHELGLPSEAIFTGYDVVDNAHFSAGADDARARAGELRSALGLPERYFLASCRFVPKKNLGNLLRGYAQYRETAGTDYASLVLLGDGPLDAEVRVLRAALGLERDILLPGFRQYAELPAYYGLAEAFVIASTTEQWGLVVNEAMAAGLPVVVSTACGCSPDLVVEGDNGYLFDPDRPDQLARVLGAVATQPQNRIHMGQRSRDLIERWSPQTFAEQLGRATDVATGDGRRAASRVAVGVLEALVAVQPRRSREA